MALTLAIALTLTIALASALVARLGQAVRTDGYGRRPPPRSWPDDRETRPRVLARLAPRSQMLSSTSTPLSPTERTRIRRVRERAASDRAALHGVLAAGLICHLGVVVDGVPRVIPTAYGIDPDGPDRDGTLYLHGSVAARSLVAAPDQSVCVTVTIVDGLVLARSGFHHSMNYRSAMVIGNPRIVTDPTEREHALARIVDRLVPGRAATLRAHTRKELAATTVLALPLHEASVKARSGGVNDDPEDVAAGGWAGVIPIRTVRDAPITDQTCAPGTATPSHVAAADSAWWLGLAAAD